ncbi:SusC/RagA family TonB-linked outer membrane protein [Chitinophaga arvensicola]|uniref:TonB-linked outer membrane protein, SusC/RagA family n=1 Tax=Chitinophaga arvensicola TaxID=29529 RepID=A0A1I0RQD4_9BACT|nr:SusC/RagA family TonB-linked outer membrane protein [Chitinophaga arvensicola]SEW43490.1 TonB-linked outer membrane protein, SusC/RagA family [Chitinophaga arvensicola]
MQKTALFNRSVAAAWASCLNARSHLIVKVMKLNFILLTCCLLQVHAVVLSQKVTLAVKNVPLQAVFDSIEKQTGYTVFSSMAVLKSAKRVTVSAVEMPLPEFLDQVLQHQDLDYFITNKTIGISPKTGHLPPAEYPATEAPAPGIEVHGKLTDKNGKPVSPATVMVKGQGIATVTRENGTYTITAPPDATLVFSMLGYKTQEVKIAGRTQMNIVMEEAITLLNSVVSTGIVERKKESFTGATVTVTGDELRQIGNQNVIQSLKTLDPSIIVLQNNQLGSNPNQLPALELRGKSSLTQTELRDRFGGDPNQPLFILDGFESDLRSIVDLDINRVASVTILKDASSTALYGSRAANGVVVVKTRQPEQGSLQVSYTADFRLDMPDLNDYNLMNAEEKLEFERLSGRYTDKNLNLSYLYQPLYDTIYNMRLKRVRMGVNTDWMDIPLRTGFTNGHSVYAYGGDQQMRYGVGVNYRKVQGVMKGSGRETWGANFDLMYNRGKLSINNKLYISGYSADESPYGAFSLYSRANPYYTPYDENGKVLRLLEAGPVTQQVSGFADVPNPLYNAMLNSMNNEKQLDIQNSLQAILRFNKDLQLQGALQLRKGSDKIEQFTPPENTTFDNSSVYEKGNYTQTRTDNYSYQANIMLTYAKVLAGVHIITANVRGDIAHSKDDAITNVAVGFPAGSNGNPSFAFSYQPNSKPQSNTNVYRRSNLLGSVNYSYDNRYLLDFTYRVDGSTAFGSAKKYSPFVSLGIGWNIYRERFFRSDVIDVLRLRGNIGSTGNQNFGSVVSTSVYAYDRKTSLLGQGLNLSAYGNSNLEWQKTISANVGMDLVMFHNRLTATVDAYRKNTDPLIVITDLPASTGIVGYATNAGSMQVKGLEATIRFTAIKQKNKGLLWNTGIFGAIVRSEYGGLGNKLTSLNDKQLASKSLVRYSDGYSPDDIWAVKSVGIDPANGREVFVKKDGQYTYTYDPADVMVVGNSRPKVEGVFSNNFSYKNFLLGISLRYQFGGDVFNDALFNKVENIDVNSIALNQDKRAFYDRWKKPGDNTRFKSISLTDNTPMSSRFVQALDVISGESVSLGYQVNDAAWLRRLRLKGFRFNVFMNDIFRISSVKAERGIDYPFANTISSSLNISF